MLEPTTAKHELHLLIDTLDEAFAQDVLDYLNNLLDGDELTEEEEAVVDEGLAEIAAGNFVWGEDLERELGL